MSEINTMKYQSGFSMVELLLSVGIISLLMLGITQFSRNMAQEEIKQREASYLLRVGEVARIYAEVNLTKIIEEGFGETYGDNNGNGDIDNDDFASVNTVINIPFDGDADGLYLRDGSAGIGEDFPEISPSGKTVQIYVRHLGVVAGRVTLEVMTVTDASRGYTLIEARDIARTIGPDAGIFRQADGCASDFEGVYGNWRIPNTTEYCPSSSEAGMDVYVAMQSRVNGDSTLSDDYLYRVAIPGRPELNRMETNIDMSGQDVVNAANIVIDNANINSALVLRSAESAQSPTLYINEGLRLAGNDSEIGEIIVMGERGAAADTVNVSVNSLSIPATESTAHVTLSTNTMDVNGPVLIGGGLAVADRVTASDLSIAEGGYAGQIGVNGSAQINGNLQVSGNVLSNGGGSMSNVVASTATTESLTHSGSLATNDLIVLEDFKVDGDSVFRSGLYTPEMQSAGLSGCGATVEHHYPYSDDDFVYPVPLYDCTGDGPN